jgi:hypothetical protein
VVGVVNRRGFLGGAFVLASSYALPEWCWGLLRGQARAGAVWVSDVSTGAPEIAKMNEAFSVVARWDYRGYIRALMIEEDRAILGSASEYWIDLDGPSKNLLPA